MHYFDSTKNWFIVECLDRSIFTNIPLEHEGKKFFICLLDDMKSLKELNTNEEPD